MTNQLIEIDNFLAFTIGIMVYFAGMWLNRRVPFLRDYNIPEPVTGGIIASLFTLGLFLVFKKELSFDLQIRDVLLVYFFTTIGLNARLSDLISGGKPLLILLGLTLGYIVFQDIIGVAAASLLGLPKAMGVLTGSASLIGGHGTAIAWAPEIAANHGVPNALEVGVAAATLGLVMASILGGPIAKFLLKKHNLSGVSEGSLTVGATYEGEKTQTLSHVNFMGVLLLMHIAIILGYILNEFIGGIGLKLPLFVSCLMVGIFLSNTIPNFVKAVNWPAHTPAMAIVSDFSLGLFIAMSLMGMQLWSIADLAGPLFIMLAAQAIAAVLFILSCFSSSWAAITCPQF